MKFQVGAGLRYHEAQDVSVLGSWGIWNLDRYGFDFQNFFHPFVHRLVRKLENSGAADPIGALLDPAFLAYTQQFFDQQYEKSPSFEVEITSHAKAIDLDGWLPYANYNWELLYHIPVAVAVQLTRNQRFAEAQRWFHYVFDPTSTDTRTPAPERFWKFLYFRNHAQSADVEQVVELLSAPASALSADQATARAAFVQAYQESVKNPFKPFAVARARTVAFQYYVVMAYLDNLIAWGDSLFTQMTIETVNEATLCYVMAANLLGPRPQSVPTIGKTAAKCFNDLKLDNVLNDAVVDLEAQFPFNSAPSSSTPGNGQPGALFGIAQSLYFCIPPNSKLLGYWDVVEDRLAKIRNCENIHGQVQLLPLFDPPIDPGMLVAAAAAGLDLNSVISGLNQPTSPVRAQLLLQKALEVAAEVKALGAGMLAASEKLDAEKLGQLRQTHEVTLHRMQQDVRFLQWQQSKAATEALLRTRATALERYSFYLRLLGQQPDSSAVPESLAVDHEAPMSVDTFESLYQDLVAKYDKPVPAQPYPRLHLAQGSSPSNQSGASGSGPLFLTGNEDVELNHHLPTARDERLAASVLDTVAAGVEMIPSLNVDLHFWGMGIHSDVFSGVKLSALSRIAADVLRTTAAWEQDQGTIAGKTAGYERRADEWRFQANLAARELVQVGRQIIGSLVAEQIACQEYKTAKEQTVQSADVLDFLQTKFTSDQLYGWMQGQLSNLHYQYYRFAVDTARKAEATMKWELMRPEVDATTYIAPNYWDGSRRGLLAGEALQLDVKRMELDYHDYNQRELELTRHVSLRQLDPVALLTLKATGTCTVSIPEWLFDRDCPGHYLRRIKTVAVSVPSVVGPYTSVNCTLSLQHSSVRVAATPAAPYARSTHGDDSRFVDYYGSLQTVVTSSAVSDSGMFETNLRDERFLPFEGAGVVSTWTIGLPPLESFDYDTITDVVLHLRYTARDGGQALATAATSALKAAIPPTVSGAPAPQLPLLISLRHDLPSEWYAFTNGAGAPFTATLTKSFFPYLVQNARTVTFTGMKVYDVDGSKLNQQTAPTPTKVGQGLADAAVSIDAALLGDPTKDYYLVLTYTAKP